MCTVGGGASPAIAAGEMTVGAAGAGTSTDGSATGMLTAANLWRGGAAYDESRD